MAETKKLAILGSTGSIGSNALALVHAHPRRFQVRSLAAYRSLQTLAEQAGQFLPKVIAVSDAEAAGQLAGLLPREVKAEIVHGAVGYMAAAVESGADLVLSAMVGVAGLLPTYAAVERGLPVALANKETLVAGGEAVMAKARETGARLLPVDSEHSAIFQALAGGREEEVSRLWLTASGGPFRKVPVEDLARVTPQQALNHPNWSMGPKITVDSSTLMNKGLEVIEAHWLFDQPLDRIKVVIHPQSIIHSMVEFVDSSILAQMGRPDMKLPIAYALAHPQRLDWGFEPLDLTSLSGLTFAEPDGERFPALGLAYAACRAGGTAPATLNAANEVAVESFLAGRVDFPGITACVQAVLDEADRGEAQTVAQVLEADREARRLARTWLEKRKGRES